MEYALIMAGGSGTRLWPLSRESRPKQSLSFIDQTSMFQHSVRRLAPLFPPERIFVVTRAEHVALLAEQTPELPPDHFIVEPEGRGTAPAIGLGVIHLRRRDPQARMAVLTADHYIADGETFRRALRAALDAADRGLIVTMGIAPSSPATGYGYIEQGEALESPDAGLPLHRVVRFTEKPDRDTAARMIASGRYSWNSGMFVWKIERVMDEFARQMPDFYAQLGRVEAALGTPEYERRIAEVWPQVAKQTIDYGVMEGAPDVAVIPVEIGWSDVGSWGSLIDLLPADADGNRRRGPHVGLDTRNTLVFGGDRLIATIGVSDLIIVDAGDAILVCHRDEEQRVREMVDELKTRRMTDLL